MQIDLPIDVDALPDISPPRKTVPTQNSHPRQKAKSSSTECCSPCPGVRVEIPEGKTPHSAYPFALHDQFGDPWDYTMQQGQLTLYARKCEPVLPHQKQCSGCRQLAEDNRLQGILDRMNEGVHNNAHLIYHSIGGLISIVRKRTAEIRTLKLRRVNDAEKLAGKLGVIDELKQWVMAVGSGKVERVDRLVRVNMAQKGGLRGLLNLYDHAAQKHYRPRNYTEEDYLRGLLLWRLGGARLVGIGHHALGLPSETMLRQHRVLPPLLVSPSSPKLNEVEENVQNVFAPIQMALATAILRVVHQVLMLDELKVEERP